MPTTEFRIDRKGHKRRLHLDERPRPARHGGSASGAATGRRKSSKSQSRDAAPRVKQERRRHIDPTTCERDYSEDEILFMRAMDDYKRKSGRMFPTWSEVLEVLHCLGYRRVEEAVELPAYKKG